MVGEQREIYSSDRYLVTFYDIDPDRLIIVFLSAGGGAIAGERVEEFRKTLLQTGVSMVFVEDKWRWWFNHPDTDEMFAALKPLQDRFAHIGALGESMGACGAILATNYLERIDRVLGLSPQFSILSPFILFDVDNRVHEERINPHRFLNFAKTPSIEKCQLVYGNCQWQDHLHRAMFEAHGFSTSVIDGANHGVAAHLKNNARLVDFIARFADFDKPFTPAAIDEALGPGWVTDVLVREDHRNPPTENPAYVAV